MKKVLIAFVLVTSLAFSVAPAFASSVCIFCGYKYEQAGEMCGHKCSVHQVYGDNGGSEAISEPIRDMGEDVRRSIISSIIY